MTWNAYTTIGIVFCIFIWLKDALKESKTPDNTLEIAKRKYGAFTVFLIVIIGFFVLTFYRVYFWPVYVVKAIWKDEL